ncbi:MAG: hypothetical protein IH880_07250 [Candidatus Marinimicrobia bacterium]|nr:hypothetical protein [Candidatus Neomarinimicrobiota bacterium]
MAFMLFGVSGISLSVGFEEHRPYLLILSGLFLSGAFYLEYGSKKNTNCDCGNVTPFRKKLKQIKRVSLWISAALAVTFMLIPQLLLLV